MKAKKLVSLGVFILILFITNFVYSKSHYKYVHSPKTDIYFGHISYTEVKHDGKDPVVIREGEREAEVAVLNFPLLPGDTIRTTESRRCEIQFDTGTIIRLDLATELKIETILAQSLSSRKKLTNLVLNKGQIYIMYKKYKYPEIFQVITPNVAVKINHKTVAMINTREDGSTDIQVKLGKACVVYGPDEKSIEEKRIKKLARLTITKDHQAIQGEYKQDGDFELWNEYVNENFEELHEGLSFLPKAIQKLPKAVFYFAQKYSNIYGEWVWDDLFGYVWRPHYNDYYPWGNWSPYFYGQWREVNGQLFWVPEESWGWVPYHLGLWIWNKKHGWLWLPGSTFAPAWATWEFFRGYYTWRPWSMWDWYFMNYYYFGYWNYYDNFYLGDYYDWQRGYYSPGKKGKKVLKTIRKDQLKKKQIPSYKLPKGLKKAYNNVVSALKRGDKRVIDSLRQIPEHMVIVRNEDLNARRIQEKAIKFQEIPSHEQKEFLSQKPFRDSYRGAVKTFKQNALKTFLRNYILSSRKKNNEPISDKEESITTQRMPVRSKVKMSKSKISSPEERTAFQKAIKISSLISEYLKPSSSLRFRDWNPDVGVARRAGVSIKYSSRDNEIRCPELGLSSSNVRGFRNLASMTGFSTGRGFYSGSGTSSSSSSSSSSSRGTGSSGSRSSGAGSRGGGSRGGSNKN